MLRGSTLAVALLTVGLWCVGASGATITLIAEDFNSSPPTTGPVVWADNDGSPTGFEWYPPGGANVRGMKSTYDHDNNAGTAEVTIPGGLEVNDDTGDMTLTATLKLPYHVDPSQPAKLTLWAGLRGNPSGAQEIEVVNVSSATSVTGTVNPALPAGATPRDWAYNSIDVPFSASDLGKTVQVQFRAAGNGGEGLQLADLQLAATANPFVHTLGDPTLVSLAADGWNANMVVQQNVSAGGFPNSLVNSSGDTWTITPNEWSFYAREARGRVTPFLVKVLKETLDDAASMETVAIGTTRIFGTDYTGTGLWTFDFGGQPFMLAPGEELAIGFLDADADGSNGGQSVIGYENLSGTYDQDMWYNGGGSLGSYHGRAPEYIGKVFGGDESHNTARNYQFNVTLTVGVPEPATLALLGLGACGLGGYVRRRCKTP